MTLPARATASPSARSSSGPRAEGVSKMTSIAIASGRPFAIFVRSSACIARGTVGGALPAPDQQQVEHALITHSHLDHVAGLAFLTETLAFSETRTPLTVATLEPVVNALRSGVFNNVAWPDFSQIPVGAP